MKKNIESRLFIGRPFPAGLMNAQKSFMEANQQMENDETFQKFLADHNLENKRIAIIGKNRYEWAIAFVSILCGVGITVPLDKGLPEQEIILSLERAKADAIVFESEYSNIMENIQKSNSRITTYICMDSNCDGKFKTVADFINEGTELLKAGNTNYDNHKIDPNAIASIIFTSGTTSMSKAVMLSNKNIASNIYNINLAEKIYLIGSGKIHFSGVFHH